MGNDNIAKKSKPGVIQMGMDKGIDIVKERERERERERNSLFENYQNAKAIYFYLKLTKICPEYLPKMCLPSTLHSPTLLTLASFLCFSLTHSWSTFLTKGLEKMKSLPKPIFSSAQIAGLSLRNIITTTVISVTTNIMSPYIQEFF